MNAEELRTRINDVKVRHRKNFIKGVDGCSPDGWMITNEIHRDTRTSLAVVDRFDQSCGK
jgi:hypothetical protein